MWILAIQSWSPSTKRVSVWGMLDPLIPVDYYMTCQAPICMRRSAHAMCTLMYLFLGYELDVAIIVSISNFCQQCLACAQLLCQQRQLLQLLHLGNFKCALADNF